jgi:type II secretory pathway component GspD/PulD (secretin)
MRPLTRLIALLSSFGACASAQFTADSTQSYVQRMAPQYEAQAAELRRAPEKACTFDKATLEDVVNFLAKDSGINFLGIPSTAPQASTIVSFSITGSPFQVLENICANHGLALIPRGNMWSIIPADDRQLEGRDYTVKFNSHERVERDYNTANAAGGAGSLATSSIDLQGAKETYIVKVTKLVNDLRQLLDLPKEREDGSDNQSSLVPLGGADGKEMKIQNTNELSFQHRPKVLWNSDSNTLYVVATRLQHMWVEGYLAVADQPQDLIQIEAKLVETNRDPSKELGIDWNGIFGQKSTYREVQGYDKDGRLQYEIKPNSEGGLRTDASILLGDSKSISNNAAIPNTLKAFAGNFNYPWFGVLSSQDLTVRLRAMLTDEATTTTSYPRAVTLNNREVAIKSVVNTPVLSSSGVVAQGGGSAAVQQVTYLPIGTVLNILPKKMLSGGVNMNVGVTLSSIIGEKQINGNSYPVATSRVYNAPVEMPSGYTVAIGGLDEARERSNQSGVPLLGRIPGLSYVFGSKSRSKNHKTMMIFITPTVINADGGGLPDEPQSVLRQKPDSLLPQKPKTDTSGNLVGGPSKLPESIAYLNREIDKIEATMNEARATQAESVKLTEMKKALNHLDTEIQGYMTQYPDQTNQLTDRAGQVAGMHDRVSTLKANYLKKSYY